MSPTYLPLAQSVQNFLSEGSVSHFFDLGLSYDFICIFVKKKKKIPQISKLDFLDLITQYPGRILKK